MHIATKLAVGLSVFAVTAATGIVQLEFKRDEELARRAVRKRQSSSTGTGSATLQLFQQSVYFVDVAVCTDFMLQFRNFYFPCPSRSVILSYWY